MPLPDLTPPSSSLSSSSSLSPSSSSSVLSPLVSLTTPCSIPLLAFFSSSISVSLSYPLFSWPRSPSSQHLPTSYCCCCYCDCSCRPLCPCPCPFLFSFSFPFPFPNTSLTRCSVSLHGPFSLPLFSPIPQTTSLSVSSFAATGTQHTTYTQHFGQQHIRLHAFPPMDDTAVTESRILPTSR